MILILSLSTLLVLSSALPSGVGQGSLFDTIKAAVRYQSADTQNVVVVPPNCPSGQTLVNGVCHDIWRANYDTETQNVVAVPPNCPVGQVLVNGVCRDIWRASAVAPIVKLECPMGYTLVGGECIDWFRNVVTVPNNCPEGQVWVNGACHEVWPTQVFPTLSLQCPIGYTLIASECIDWLRNVVTVPSNCPEGQVWVNGACRDVWRGYLVVGKPAAEPVDPKNTVTVAENCKPNQQFINGQCRDIWLYQIKN